jgi:hypothetical protein
VLFSESCCIFVIDKRSSDAFDFICSDADADSGSADTDTEIKIFVDECKT